MDTAQVHPSHMDCINLPLGTPGICRRVGPRDPEGESDTFDFSRADSALGLCRSRKHYMCGHKILLVNPFDVVGMLTNCEGLMSHSISCTPPIFRVPSRRTSGRSD